LGLVVNDLDDRLGIVHTPYHAPHSVFVKKNLCRTEEKKYPRFTHTLIPAHASQERSLSWPLPTPPISWPISRMPGSGLRVYDTMWPYPRKPWLATYACDTVYGDLATIFGIVLRPGMTWVAHEECSQRSRCYPV
jgi:hypothetical protein